MSETANIPAKVKLSRVKILVVVLSVLILLLIYGAGIVVLPITILTSYRDAKCDTVLSLHKIYETLYPKFIEDTSLSVQITECDVYMSAVSSEKAGLWNDAYDAYQTYSTQYAGGMYAKEAYEHSASALIHIIQEQSEQQKYADAITNLDLIITHYSDTEASADAWTLMPVVYTSWGCSLRETKKFEEAERVFNDFKSWSEHYQRNEVVPDAKRELAEIYVSWGMDLQMQKQYETALSKLELAAKADPAVDSNAVQRKVYVEWGNELLEQDHFAVAVEKFDLAVSKSNDSNEDGVQDVLSNGYIVWARDFTAHEDYFGALEHLEKAKEAAVTDEMKKSVDSAFEETYTAFSKSTGSQAKQAMKEALKSVCEQRKKPDLPIFGLNKGVIHVGIFGADASLPETLAAKTPGEMHYVACVNLQKDVIDSRNQVYIIKSTSKGYYWTRVHQQRVRVLWNMDLIKMDTLEKEASKTFPGGMPPPYPEAWADVRNGIYEGPPPTLTEIAQWLQSVLK